MSVVEIAVINEYDGITDDEVVHVMEALQIQVNEHYFPAWGKKAQLTFYAKNGSPPPEDAWQLVFFDNPSSDYPKGYHDLTHHGLPMGKVFAGVDIRAHTHWSVTASHELLEMLGDPGCCLAVVDINGSDINAKHLLYAYENCDSCQDDIYAYQIGDVWVSDFVYPSWFEKFQPAGTRFDHRNKITAPFQVLPFGSINIKSTTDGWVQQFEQSSPLRYCMRAQLGSRREKRSIPRHQWIKSNPWQCLPVAI